MNTKKILRILTDYHYLLQGLVKKCSPLIKDDKLYLSLRYYFTFGKKLNWENPVLFTEKIQWLKVNNRKPEYVIMADKVKAKDWVAERIGEEHIIPTLGVWERADDIDFDSLPNKFVIKCNHNSGTGMYICKDKSTMDVEKVREGLRKGLLEDYYKTGREWPYKEVPRLIIAEQFMEEKGHPGDLADYKFFCFNGEPKYCQVIRDRSTKETIDFYDMNWNHQEFCGLNPEAQNGLSPVAPPVHLSKLQDFCRTLSKDMPFARVDFYVINDKEYFGEVTFFPASGMGVFTPEKYDEMLGKMLTLPGQHMGGVKITISDDSNIIIPFSSDLKDYKFFCFNGKVKFFKIDFDRFTNHGANYYAPNGELLEFGEADYPPRPEKKLNLPYNLPQMISFAERLSKGHPFLRVDFYSINERIYFGELTFFPASGMDKFTPNIWDRRIGDYIKLP